MTNYTFVKSDCIISSTTKVLNTRTSEVFEISVYDRIVWNFMLARFEFFNSQQLKYFESQTEISKALGISTDSVQKAIKKLKSIGILDYYREKRQGHIFRNIYTKISHPSSLKGLVFYDIQNNVLILRDFQVQQTKVNTSVTYSESREPF